MASRVARDIARMVESEPERIKALDKPLILVPGRKYTRPSSFTGEGHLLLDPARFKALLPRTGEQGIDKDCTVHHPNMPTFRSAVDPNFLAPGSERVHVVTHIPGVGQVRLVSRRHANGEVLHGIHIGERLSAPSISEGISNGTFDWKTHSTGRSGTGRTPLHEEVVETLKSHGDTKTPDGVIKLPTEIGGALWRTYLSNRGEVGPGNGDQGEDTANGYRRVRLIHLGKHDLNPKNTTEFGKLATKIKKPNLSDVTLRAVFHRGAGVPSEVHIISSAHAGGTAAPEPVIDPASAEGMRRADQMYVGPSSTVLPGASRGTRPLTKKSLPNPAGMLFPFAIWAHPSLYKSEDPWDKPEAKDKPNTAKDKKKWGNARRAASKKFGKKNSYVKNMWAVRQYNKRGGKWKRGDKKDSGE